MTDDELAKLKPGDRVQSEAHSYGVGVVIAIDRRLVHVRWNGDVIPLGAEKLTIVPPESQEVIPDDLALRSLESRWRALTDEVLAAIKACVADGTPLGEIAVMFNVTDDIACAEILVANEAATLEMGGLVTCAVGVTERVHRVKA